MTIAFPMIQQHQIPTGLSYASIPSDTGGSLTIATGISGKTTDVWRILLSSSVLTTITFKSGTETKFTFQMQAGIPFFVDVPFGPRYKEGNCGYPCFQTNDGETLTLTWTASAQIDGCILFNQRPTSAI
jgi:hypothetical protein